VSINFVRCFVIMTEKLSFLKPATFNLDHDYCYPVSEYSSEIVNKNTMSKSGSFEIDNTVSKGNIASSDSINKHLVNQEDQTGKWQTVTNNKRSIHDNKSINIKKSCLGLSSTDLVTTKNRFETLSNSNEMEEEVELSEPKPPPIFIPDVSDVKKMTSSIESVLTKEEYSYKCLFKNKVKISTTSSDSYRKLVRKLNDLKVSFHTYQLKQERAYRVVLKNMHSSTDVQEIKDSIEAAGHLVRNISNAKSFHTKEPLSMFFIDLEPNHNNKDIYELQFLLNAKVTFEPPRKNKEAVQCKKCQRYGHTKTYCWHPFRCVKCGQNHDTKSCSKSNTTPAKCVLCDGDHPANYRGCSVYKEMKHKSSPPLRGKSLNKSNEILASQPQSTEQPSVPSTSEQPNTKSTRLVSGSMTYAQAASPTSPLVSNTDNGFSMNFTQTLNSFFDKFEKLMSQQAQQIGTLITLLTTVISKIK
jgi:hypothetical protein